MEIIGTSRLKDGIEVDEFVIRCSEHPYFFAGRPPITTGCSDCWLVFYFGNLVRSKGDMKMNLDQLEQAIRHAGELAEKGEFDFKPDFSVDISTEN